MFWREYKLTPSMVMLNYRLQTSSFNLLGHESSICFMTIKSTRIYITHGSLLSEACHSCNTVNSLKWKILWIFDIIGTCLNILSKRWYASPFKKKNYATCYVHILDTSLFLCICLSKEYNNSEKCDMRCTQHSTFW